MTAPATNTPAISVRNLTKSFAGGSSENKPAVNNASFDVPFGSITGFIGGNGSGKTTTMRMIVGLIRPTSGTAVIDGQPYEQLARPRSRVGAVLNQLGAHPTQTGFQHVRIIATEAGVSSDRVAEVLEMVGLDDAANRKIRTYSTGMKQRLSIAASMLEDPDILVLDEPASGLDPVGIRWLRDLLRRRADEGAAVFVSTHQLAELASIVDHVVVIDAGHIVANEPSQSLLERTGETRLEDAVFRVSTAIPQVTS